MIRWLRNFPMLFRVMFIVIVAVVVVLAVFAYLGSDALDNSTRRIQESELRYASLAAGNIDSRLENYFGILADHGAILSGGWNDPAKRQDVLLRLRGTGSFPGGVFLLGGDGNVLRADPALTPAETDELQGSAFVTKAVSTGDPQVSGFLETPGSKPGIYLLQPIRNPSEVVIGWIGGWIELDALPIRDFIQISELQTGGRATVVDLTGNSLEIGASKKLMIEPFPYYENLNPILRRRAAAVIVLDKKQIDSKENVVAVLAPLEKAQWTVVVSLPENEIYGLLYTLRWQFVYFGAAMLITALLAALVEEELVLVPIRELLRATRRLASGDLSTPINTVGHDETAELSREFEVMRFKLADWGEVLSSAVERQTHKLSTLYAIDQVAAKTLALEEVLSISLERVLDLMNMDAGVFLLEESGVLRTHVQKALPIGLADVMGGVASLQSPIGAAVAEKRVMITRVQDMAEDPLTTALSQAGFQTAAGIPLIAKDRAVGVLVLLTRQERTFAAGDIDLLETIGKQIGGSVQNAQLFEAEQHRREQAEKLYELGAEIISTSTLHDAARVIGCKVAQSAHAHSVVVTLIDPGGHVVLRVGADPSGLMPPEPPPRPHGVTMQVFLEGRSLAVPEPDTEEILITPRLLASGVRSMIGLPLNAAGRVIGTLFVRYFEPRVFTGEEVKWLTTFANTAAMALERARLLEETGRRLKEVGALFDLSSVLRGTTTLQEMLPILLRQTLQMARADAAGISLVEGNDIVCRAAEGLAEEVVGRRVPIGEGLVGGVAERGEMCHTPFLPRDPLLIPSASSVAVVRGVGSALCLPLRTADEVVGALLLVSYGHAQFGEDEIRLLTAAADIAGGSIHRASLFSQLDHRVHELSSLYEFSQAVSTSLRSEEVVRLVVGSVPPAVHAGAVCVFLWDEGEERLVLQETAPGNAAEAGEVKYRAGEGLVGWVFLEGHAVIVPDVLTDPRWKSEPENEEKIFGFRVKDALAVPLTRGKRVLGVLLAMNRRIEGGFDEADLSLFSTLAGQAAIAIENATLFESIRGLSVATISSLAAAIDARDPYTRGHSEDVTKNVVLLARELGWEGSDLEMIEFAALLHDVGKIAVPDDILRKPKDLVPDEWDVIYLHPYHSAQIIRPVEPLRRIVPWIYHHHEHWDGSGYPDRLKGEAIPEGARIISVVDAFNAITTDRPYHKALSEEEGLREIARNAGTQFDRRIVKAFLKIMRRKKSKGH
jgi:HD-GYP domain-containing protein (c-di-GMP phosphodiesterase class II)/putative methionine-R-sulfoxide reductase with GAF domain/HAMP domain-containing protein